MSRLVFLQKSKNNNKNPFPDRERIFYDSFSLLDELGNLFGQIVLTLLNALALLKAGIGNELHVRADFLGDSGDVLLDGDLVVLDERLLHEADLLEVLASR